MDVTLTAVLDRFERTQDDEVLAVLLLEHDGEVVDEAIVARERLPAQGRHADAVFDVTIADGQLTDFDYLPEESTARSDAAQSRFDRLARRPPDDTEE